MGFDLSQVVQLLEKLYVVSIVAQGVIQKSATDAVRHHLEIMDQKCLGDYLGPRFLIYMTSERFKNSLKKRMINLTNLLSDTQLDIQSDALIQDFCQISLNNESAIFLL